MPSFVSANCVDFWIHSSGFAICRRWCCAVTAGAALRGIIGGTVWWTAHIINQGPCAAAGRSNTWVRRLWMESNSRGISGGICGHAGWLSHRWWLRVRDRGSWGQRLRVRDRGSWRRWSSRAAATLRDVRMIQLEQLQIIQSIERIENNNHSARCIVPQKHSMSPRTIQYLHTGHWIVVSRYWVFFSSSFLALDFTHYKAAQLCWAERETRPASTNRLSLRNILTLTSILVRYLMIRNPSLPGQFHWALYTSVHKVSASLHSNWENSVWGVVI